MMNIDASFNGRKSLFMVYTPFQGLCALNAIKQLKIVDYTFFISRGSGLRQKQLERLLDKNGVKFTYYNPIKVTSFFSMLAKKHQEYDAIFIGDYFYGLSGYAQAALSAHRGSKLVYLDDGASTLELFSEKPRKREGGLVNYLIYFLYGVVLLIKGVGKPYFYTIFDVESKRFHVIKNELTENDSKQTPKDIFIIGTNSKMLHFDGYTYHELLFALNNYIKIVYPDQDIFYCPHGGDPNNEKNIEYCKKLGMKIFDTEVSVEYDFFAKKNYPKMIVGFNSTALYTLHNAYPKSKVENISFRLKDVDLEIAHSDCRLVFEKNGINTVTVI